MRSKRNIFDKYQKLLLFKNVVNSSFHQLFRKCVPKNAFCSKVLINFRNESFERISSLPLIFDQKYFSVLKNCFFVPDWMFLQKEVRLTCSRFSPKMHKKKSRKGVGKKSENSIFSYFLAYFKSPQYIDKYLKEISPLYQFLFMT